MKLLLIIISLFTFSIAKNHLYLGTEEWPPFSFYNKKEKKVDGFSTEVIENTFKKMNVKIDKIKILPWVRTEKLGFEGKFDAVYTASKNSEREKYMYFPEEPIITSRWVLFGTDKKIAQLNLDNYTNLKNKRFCLIRGYNYPKKFKNYILKNAKITETYTEISNIEKLLYHRCDYMPAVLETTIYLTHHNAKLKKIGAYKKLYYFKTPLATTNFYLMFSKKRVSKEFVNKFSKELKEFKKTPKYKNLEKKYLF